jgi:hypothetical protein
MFTFVSKYFHAMNLELEDYPLIILPALIGYYAVKGIGEDSHILLRSL